MFSASNTEQQKAAKKPEAEEPKKPENTENLKSEPKDDKTDGQKPAEHFGVTCDGCGVHPITGIRHNCTVSLCFKGNIYSILLRFTY